MGHLALYLCSPGLMFARLTCAAGLSWGLMERDLGGTEKLLTSVWVALPPPFLLMLLLALGWQLLPSSLLGPPDGRRKD